MNLAESLGQRVGPFPAWLWAIGVGCGLYWFAHHQSSKGLPTYPVDQTFSPLAGGAGALLGSPAALAGPVLQLNPVQSNGINSQPGAALVAPSGGNVPTTIPQVSGGDNPFTSGYVGLPVVTPYTRSRGGPS